MDAKRNRVIRFLYCRPDMVYHRGRFYGASLILLRLNKKFSFAFTLVHDSPAPDK
jgi:hypothetical protein